ncbi:hypothetical protein PRIPAC_97644 [Pristionchus pacificus]|uniref:Uncharacterized protein n=1 Tax=Pristionchus pacificus TaxID=54126 RepID=A0A2A6BJY0_PRIPA|nr:hypothetical protein PRIPAC_97644 [Pristionchus pacificus]|eukprot:PDM66220.1 hypothetical protein PRIPAC_45445 [Pristionchus pacificus]
MDGQHNPNVNVFNRQPIASKKIAPDGRSYVKPTANPMNEFFCNGPLESLEKKEEKTVYVFHMAKGAVVNITSK